jgi:hypothetical protein
MMAVLLKVAAAQRPCTNDSVAGFTQLYTSITYLQLTVQMIDHLLLNIPLWITHPFNFQKLFFKEFFAHVSQIIQKHPHDPALSERICITRILYLIRLHLCESEGNVPEQQQLRSIFWGLTVFISGMFLSDEDVA